MMSTGRHGRVTLDAQLLGYWEREAARLDALAAGAGAVWQRRRYARKAEQARAKADVSRRREADRDGGSGDPTT